MNIYLNHRERKRLAEVSKELGVTQAYVLRLAFRAMVGMPLKEHHRDELAKAQCGHVQNLTSSDNHVS